MRIKIILGLLLTIGFPLWAAADLEQGFGNPPHDARPQVWWQWMNGNITKEGITADLEAMARVGLGGANIFNLDCGIPCGQVKFMSAEWLEMVRYAVKEAGRLGLQIGLENCAGWSSSGGPWITPEQNMQVVVTHEQAVHGPAHFAAVIPKPQTRKDFYRDVALLAFPTPRGETTHMREMKPKITVDGVEVEAAKLMDGQLGTKPEIPAPGGRNRNHQLQIEFAEPYAARSLLIAADVLPHSYAEVQVSDDGETFKPLRTVVTSDWREGIQLGLTPGGDPVKARFCRVLLPSWGRMALAEVNLSDRLSVEQFSTKAAKLRAQGFDAGPQFTISHDSVAARAGQAVPDHVVSREKIIDLSDRMAPDGRLEWDVPPGDWTLLRIGHAASGSFNHPAPEGGEGLECDKFSKAAAEAHWAGMMQKVVDAAGPLAGKSLTGVTIDSWEVGCPNWTAAFPEEFRKRRGYDLRPFLPVLSNRVVESPEVTERFLWDMRRTIGELFAENYYGHFATMAHRNNLQLSVEAYGNGPMDEIPSSGAADNPMATFWYSENANRQDPSGKLNASAAHIYGRKIIGAEAYTGGRKWLEHPYRMKPLGDQMFCSGINRFVFHASAMQPWRDMAPGMTMGQWGINYNRPVTWWEQSAAWITYLSRCQYLLQEGRFVADVCVLSGEDYLAGISNPPLPAGYDYDLCDRGTLLERMKFENGFFTLPSGMRYRYLVLPDSKALTLPVVKKIRDLVAAGGTVIGPKPQFSPTLQDYPACEREIRRIADEVWGQCDGKSVTENRFGKGRVIWGKTYAEVFASANLPPDFEANPALEPAVSAGRPSDGLHATGQDGRLQGLDVAGSRTVVAKALSQTSRITYIHRTSKEADWYFLASADKTPIQTLCSFRVTGKLPEFWYPDTGKIEPATEYWVENGQTFVPMHFDPVGSVFVVFREKAAGNGHSGLGAGGLRRWSFGSSRALPAGDGRLQNPPVTELTGPWQVTFDSKWFYPDNGMKAKVEFKQLEDWSKRSEEAIKYFSGTAVYRKDFVLPEIIGYSLPVIGKTNNREPITHNQPQMWLDLGRVEVIAEVELNGKNLGVLWKPPFRVDVTEALKPGQKNKLRVKVTNLWPNRLIGDEHLPADCEYAEKGNLVAWPQWLLENKARTSGRRTFTTWRHYKADDPLLPSGLLGPVRLVPATVTAITGK